MLDVLTPTLPQAKNFKPEQFVDLSFCRNLKKKVSSTRWRNGIRSNKPRWSGGVSGVLE